MAVKKRSHPIPWSLLPKRNFDQSDVLIHADGIELHPHESGLSETSQHTRVLLTSRVSHDAGMAAMCGGDESSSVQAQPEYSRTLPG